MDNNQEYYVTFLWLTEQLKYLKLQQIQKPKALIFEGWDGQIIIAINSYLLDCK